MVRKTSCSTIVTGVNAIARGERDWAQLWYSRGSWGFTAKEQNNRRSGWKNHQVETSRDRGLLLNWPDAILANDSPRTKCCQEWRWGTRVIRYQGLGLTRILAKSRLTKEGHGSQGRGLLEKRAQRSLTRILSRSFLVTAVHRICGRIPESRLMRKLAGKY